MNKYNSPNNPGDKTSQELFQELTILHERLEEIKKKETELKTAEEELKKSAEKHRNLLELAPDSIVTVDLKGFVLSCNKSVFRISGYSKDDIIGKHISKLPFFRKKDIPKYIKIFNSLLKGQLLKPFEFIWIHKDGTQRFSEVHVALMKKDGKIEGIQAIIRDITERKKAEEQLKRYKQIVESSNDALFIKDLESKYILVNKKVLELFGGIPRKKIIGKNDKGILPLDDALHNIRDDKEVFKTGKQQDFIKKNTIEGIDYWFHATKIPLKDDKGKIIGLIGIGRDITERKKAEEALRESEKNFRNIFQFVPESLLAVNNQMELLNSNKAFGELICKYAPKLKISEDELQEKILSELRKHFGKRKHGIIEID